MTKKPQLTNTLHLFLGPEEIPLLKEIKEVWEESSRSQFGVKVTYKNIVSVALKRLHDELKQEKDT